jgi:peptidoglycan/LPS O-acetylase OafA/YrhL
MENKYYEEIDISRGIAIIGVVILHASSLYLSRFYNNYLWIINSMARFSVPLFIVISGFLHKDIADIREGVVRSYLKYIARRARRILLPYLLFSMFYMIIRLAIENIPYVRSLIPLRFTTIMSVYEAIFFVKGNPAGQLYFLPLLFFVFVTFVLLKTIVRRDNVLLPVCAGSSLLAYYFAGDIYLSIDPLKGLIFYAMGYGIKKYRYGQVVSKSTPYALGFSLLYVIFLLGYSLDLKILGRTYLMFGIETFGALYFYLFSLVLTSGRLAVLKAFLVKIGQYSFDIYLLHEPYIVTAIFMIFAKLSLVNVFINQSILLILGIVIPFLMSDRWLRNIKAYRQYCLGLG